MTAGTLFGLAAQFAAIILLAIGFYHEKTFVAIEDRIIRRIKRSLRRRLASWLETPAKNSAPAQPVANNCVICAAGVFEDLIPAEQLLEVHLEPCALNDGQNIVA